jgi:hypothetical protein
MEFKVSTLFIEQSLKKHFHKHSLLGDKKYFDPYLVPVAKELEDSFPAHPSRTQSHTQTLR